MIVTFSDAVDYCLNYLAKDARESPEAKRIVINAYRVLANKRPWNYYKRFIRLMTNAAFSEGTVQYDSATNIMTLSGSVTGPVLGASNASPIEIYSPNHGLQTGQSVTITGALGNTAANGTFTVTIVDQDNFDLDGSTGNGVWTSGGTWTEALIWPYWILSGYFRFGLVNYYVTPASLISTTQISIDPSTQPGVDFPAGTAYVLMMDAYPLPQDFRSIISINWQAGTYNPAYVDVEEFVNLSTLVTGPSAPCYYTIYGDRQLLGTKDIRFYPAPDLAYPTNLYYNGSGRPLQIEYYQDGTASCTVNSLTVTGLGTLWTQSMVGSVIRFWGGAPKNKEGDVIYPTGVDGLYPATIEAIIIQVNSPTSLVIDQSAELALSGVPYRISDPVDVYENGMMDAFYREIDYQARRSMRSKEISPEEMSAYKMAYQFAFEADSVYDGQRVAMAARHRPRLLREYPINTSG